jgi:hypothetical protein
VKSIRRIIEIHRGGRPRRRIPPDQIACSIPPAVALLARAATFG